jgi:beta-lactamase class A
MQKTLKFFNRYEWYIGTGAVCLVIGIAIGIFLPVQSPLPIQPNQYEIGGGYRFINPLLECGDQDFSRTENSQVVDLQNNINSYISQQEQAGALDDASVYFYELNGGQSLDINPSFEFVPASLLKVPLAMSIYQQAEENDPTLLKEKVLFAASEAAPAEEYFTAPTITASSTYTVEQLVDAMIINSDNNAALLLTHVISTADLEQSYSDLGLTSPSNTGYTMTTGQYASFFRILYDATYLDHTDSEHLLDLLSQSVFTKGLVAGVPQGIVVAHKFGERGFDNSNPNQLHDCGIVYAKQPYVVCIATQGQDYDTLAGVIANISKMIYAYAGP